MTVVEEFRLLSNSEVQTFKDCPRKWWLAWHRGLKPKTRQVTGARSTGTRIHLALAALYTPNATTGDAQKMLSYAQRVDRKELDDQLSAAQFTETSETQTTLLNAEYAKLLSAFDLEHAMIEGYVEWLAETGIDADLEVVSVEQRVDVEFADEHTAFRRGWRYAVRLIAKIDARVRSHITGAIKFIDHKTVGTLIDPVLGLNQQMLHYHVIEDILTEATQPHSEGALYNMLRKVKRTRASRPPYYARVPIDHNRFELVSYIAQLLGVVDRLEQVEKALESHPQSHHAIVPPRPSRDCSWKCDFFKICRMFDDGSRVEAAIDEHYQVGDPLAYYDDNRGDEWNE